MTDGAQQSNQPADTTQQLTPEQALIVQTQISYLELTYGKKLTHLITYQCFHDCILHDRHYTGRLGRQLTSQQTQCITDCVSQRYRQYTQGATTDLNQV